MANLLCKPIRSALNKVYGAKNVSVRNGRGTAWGWVEICVTLPEINHEHNMVDTPYGTFCTMCNAYLKATKVTVEETALKSLQGAGLKPYTYCSDDGYNTDNDCILVDVSFAKSSPVIS